MTRSSIPVTGILLALVAIAATTADTLPEGQGLAARYPNDVGIASDPAVIFTDDFESYANGADLGTRWTNAFQLSNVRIATEPGSFVGGGKSLEFTVPVTTSEVSNGVSKAISPELDVLFLRYYAKYDPSFDVLGSSHNGGVISAHYCCPGQRSDGFNKFLVSYEASRFAATKANPGELNAYVYLPDMRDVYGDHFHPTGVIAPYVRTPPFSFGPDFVPRSEVTPALGRWYAYELMVKANTPGRRDGRIALWLDGRLIAEFPNLRLRDTSALKIDRVALNWHVNAVTRTTTKRWYDDVVAATSYIGPRVSAQ
jgi:hypothetical protein